MEWKFFVPGPLPGLNEIVDAAKRGGKGLAYSSQKKQWTDAVYWRSMEVRVPRLTRVRLILEWVHANTRRDKDNVEAGQKYVWDGLVGPKEACRHGRSVLANDGWDQNAGVEHRHVVGPKPGVFVTVIPVEAS